MQNTTLNDDIIDNEPRNTAALYAAQWAADAINKMRTREVPDTALKTDLFYECLNTAAVLLKNLDREQREILAGEYIASSLPDDIETSPRLIGLRTALHRVRSTCEQLGVTPTRAFHVSGLSVDKICDTIFARIHNEGISIANGDLTENISILTELAVPDPLDRSLMAMKTAKLVASLSMRRDTEKILRHAEKDMARAVRYAHFRLTAIDATPQP